SAANLMQGFGVRMILARILRQRLTGPIDAGLTRSRGLLQLLVCATGASILSYPITISGIWLSIGHWSWVDGWVIRNSCGTFVVAAAVLTITSAFKERSSTRHGSMLTAEPRPHSRLELVAATAVTLGVGFLVFAAPQQLPISYVLIATSAWVGFRFAPSVGAVHSLGLGTLALACTLAGWGPFGAIEDPMAEAVVVQLFVAVTAMIVLLLAFGVTERENLTTRLRLLEANASGRADLVDAVTMVMTDGLIVVDANLDVLLSNPAAERMAGIFTDSSQVANKEAYGVFRLDGSSPPRDELPRARALKGEFVPPTELLCIDPKTGEQRILSISAAPLQPADPDEPALAVIVMRDVTKLRAQRRELENFAGVVAHDLKTPLTGVISWAEILEEQLTEAAIVGGHPLGESVQRIRSSADRMADLISDLLAYTQAQNAELSVESVSLDQLVDQISRDLLDTHHREVPVVEHEPLGNVLADRILVRQLLTNVIGNAVKYVAPGIVPRIVVSSAPMDDMLEIWVSDNGIGIPGQERGRVFDSFFRASGTREYPGTGLGLAICAQTVERHGGRISTRQGPGGVGTTMIFTLPLDPAAALAQSVQPDLEEVIATS
ncbi:MAG: ATP-binding protein, partial [Marmoricola sp.]